MKRYGLLLTTLGSVVVTGLALYAAGWFSGGDAANTTAARARRQALDAAALQYQQYQPRHGSSLHYLLQIN
jgi:hypothetical protein